MAPWVRDRLSIDVYEVDDTAEGASARLSAARPTTAEGVDPRPAVQKAHFGRRQKALGVA
jgi:hypothetical protein